MATVWVAKNKCETRLKSYVKASNDCKHFRIKFRMSNVEYAFVDDALRIYLPLTLTPFQELFS